MIDGWRRWVSPSVAESMTGENVDGSACGVERDRSAESEVKRCGGRDVGGGEAGGGQIVNGLENRAVGRANWNEHAWRATWRLRALITVPVPNGPEVNPDPGSARRNVDSQKDSPHAGERQSRQGGGTAAVGVLPCSV